ncbi:MAG: hypothetical protein IIA60_14650, partial [Candidatus Marinimicrobia bacterium]|nr:hypothetical protein [Candidatus Neomarinimicrobiota bacterium]
VQTLQVMQPLAGFPILQQEIYLANVNAPFEDHEKRDAEKDFPLRYQHVYISNSTELLLMLQEVGK